MQRSPEIGQPSIGPRFQSSAGPHALTTSGNPATLFRPRFLLPEVGSPAIGPARSRLDFSKQIQKAEEALRRRNYDFAVELYRQLTDLDPDQGEARSGLRRALKKRVEQEGGKGRLFKAM